MDFYPLPDNTYAVPAGKEIHTTKIAIPSSHSNKPVTAIAERGFACCASLTSGIIGNGVTSIDYSAFCGCTALTSITFENLNGWHRTTTIGATSGMNMNVSNAQTNARDLTTYFFMDFYLYRK